MKVLLVEDSQLFSYYLLRGLKKENYTVDLAENGMDGLNLAINNYLDYSIVLLDWNLPDMTGIQVCKYLRKIDSNIPIIFLTGQSNSEDGHRMGNIERQCNSIISRSEASDAVGPPPINYHSCSANTAFRRLSTGA